MLIPARHCTGVTVRFASKLLNFPRYKNIATVESDPNSRLILFEPAIQSLADFEQGDLEYIEQLSAKVNVGSMPLRDIVCPSWVFIV